MQRISPRPLTAHHSPLTTFFPALICNRATTRISQPCFRFAPSLTRPITFNGSTEPVLNPRPEPRDGCSLVPVDGPGIDGSHLPRVRLRASASMPWANDGTRTHGRI